MSGVIDENGVQWEHCTACAKFVKIDDLGYEPPLKATPCGRDLCLSCVNKLPYGRLRRIRPAAGWLPVYGKKESEAL